MTGEPVSLACETLQAALRPLKDSPSDGTTRPEKKVLHDIAEKLKSQAAQGAVLWMSDVPPSAESQSSFLHAFQQSVITFCTCCHGFTSQAGPSLLSDLQAGAQAVVDASIDLLKGLGAKEQAEVRQLVGKLWEACAAVKQLPLDNKSSIFRRLLKHVTVIKDVVRELDDLEATQPKEAGSSPAAPEAEAGGKSTEDEDEEDDEFDLDYDAGPLSEAEMRVLKLSKAAIDVTLNSLKQFGKWLLRGSEVTEETGLESWESLLFHANNLQRCTEELGAALYTPQDRGDLLSVAESMSVTVEVLLLESPPPASQQQQAGAADFTKDVEKMQTECEAAFEALVAELQGA